MSSVSLWVAVAAVGAIGLVVTSLLSGSGGAISRGRQEREGAPPGGSGRDARPANVAPPGMRMAMVVSAVVLAVGIVALFILLLF